MPTQPQPKHVLQSLLTSTESVSALPLTTSTDRQWCLLYARCVPQQRLQHLCGRQCGPTDLHRRGKLLKSTKGLVNTCGEQPAWVMPALGGASQGPSKPTTADAGVSVLRLGTHPYAGHLPVNCLPKASHADQKGGQHKGGPQGAQS